jgi:hypothetical protein
MFEKEKEVFFGFETGTTRGLPYGSGRSKLKCLSLKGSPKLESKHKNGIFAT